MLVKVISRKGHWAGENQFVPMGGTFDYTGTLEGMADRLALVDGVPVVEVKEDAPPPPGALTWGALPQSVIDKLKNFGLDTPEKVKAASDDSLLAIDGIGAATIKVIREQIKEGG